MNSYEGLAKEDLIAKINELEILLDAMKETNDHQELLNFPWIGNLGNWYWLVKSNQVICNEQKFFALGYSKEEIPEKIGFEFFTKKLHPDDYERVMECMRDHLDGKTPVYETSYRIKSKQNDWIWFYDHGKATRRSESGKAEIVTGIVFDITEQKRVEQLLESQNQQLVEMSNIDYLTNIYNRRYLFEKLDYEMRRAQRNKDSLSVLMLDIDFFKKINDTFDHLTGDQVLVQVASQIKRMIRNTDILGRYGGEEFLVILPGCNLSQGLKLAEKIRLSIQNFEFESHIKITLSGGLCEYKNETINDLIGLADHCLYKAKKNGRNRIEFSAE